MEISEIQFTRSLDELVREAIRQARAAQNRATVRALLRQSQPRYADALETAIRALTCECAS